LNKDQHDNLSVKDVKNSTEKCGDKVYEKDAHGCTKALRAAIDRKYDIIELIGTGSYGCVNKAKCKATGRIVALKIMIN